MMCKILKVVNTCKGKIFWVVSVRGKRTYLGMTRQREERQTLTWENNFSNNIKSQHDIKYPKESE